jgi:hypothetical protein
MCVNVCLNSETLTKLLQLVVGGEHDACLACRSTPARTAAAAAAAATVNTHVD